MTRKTGLEKFEEGSVKERIVNFFNVKGAKTDIELIQDEVEDEVRFEIAAKKYFNELDEKENEVLKNINDSCKEREFKDEIPDIFWKI